jgi:hypothetical protein
MNALSRFTLLDRFIWLIFIALTMNACGNFTLDPPPVERDVNRRLYVNDRTSADSLTATVVNAGIKFVLQPGKNYELSIATTRTKDRLTLFYYSEGIQGQFQTLNAISNGQQEIFSIASDRSAAQFFVGQLLVPDGLGAIKSLGHVSLTSNAAIGADTLHLRLLFIRQLRNLPDSLSKAAFATRLFAAMAPIYTPFGIVIKGSYEIVEPTLSREIFPFKNVFVPLPGKRTANNAHLYLVDTITIGDPGSGLVGEVLGFAPREVVDLDQNSESRVILANPFPLGTTVERLAITAAHELGHFFGLRHTVSTRHDLLQDEDFSNIEDGFLDTKFCNLDQALIKSGTIPVGPNKAGTVYCLRLADNSCDARICDLKNLMHPVDCGSLGQTVLSVEQASFLKLNLATYRH